MIFRWFRQRAEAATRARNAQLVAERAFASAYPDRRLISDMTFIFNDDGSDLVVQLCHDWGGIPPHRSWWQVFSDGSCRELSRAEANRIRPLPVWR